MQIRRMGTSLSCCCVFLLLLLIVQFDPVVSDDDFSAHATDLETLLKDASRHEAAAETPRTTTATTLPAAAAPSEDAAVESLVEQLTSHEDEGLAQKLARDGDPRRATGTEKLKSSSEENLAVPITANKRKNPRLEDQVRSASRKTQSQFESSKARKKEREEVVANKAGWRTNVRNAEKATENWRRHIARMKQRKDFAPLLKKRPVTLIKAYHQYTTVEPRPILRGSRIARDGSAARTGGEFHQGCDWIATGRWPTAQDQRASEARRDLNLSKAALLRSDRFQQGYPRTKETETEIVSRDAVLVYPEVKQLVFVYDEYQSGLTRTQVAQSLEAAYKAWKDVNPRIPNARFVHQTDRHRATLPAPQLNASSHDDMKSYQNWVNEITFQPSYSNFTNPILFESYVWVSNLNPITKDHPSAEHCVSMLEHKVRPIQEVDLVFGLFHWMDFAHYTSSDPRACDKVPREPRPCADFQALATAAFGHALGLTHNDCHDHSMTGLSVAGEHHKASLECGDIAGIRALYPPPSEG